MEFDSKAMTEAAKSLEGTPWKWRGWKARIAVDCLYSTFFILRAAGVVPDTRGGKNYYSQATGARDTYPVAAAYITSVLHVEETDPKPGAIAVFKSGTMTSHLGIITEGGLSHIIKGRTFCTENLTPWMTHILRFYTPVGIGYKTDPSKISIPQLSTK